MKKILAAVLLSMVMALGFGAQCFASEADYTDQVEVVEQYLYEDSFSTMLFLVIRNNSPETLEINVNATIMDANGQVIGADNANARAIGSGCNAFVNCYFSWVKGAANFNYTISAKKDTTYQSVVQNIIVAESRTDKNVVVTCANVGTLPAEFLQADALFFKDGQLVYHNYGYVTDGDYELKPNAVLSEQINCYEDYDDVKIYLSGRKSKWS